VFPHLIERPAARGLDGDKHPRLRADDKDIMNESSARAGALFQSEFERRAERRFSLREAGDADRHFLARLLADVHAEAQRRLGGEGVVLDGPLLDLQMDAQRRAYRSTYPLAIDYIVVRGACGDAIGRMLIDWSSKPAGTSTVVDVALLSGERSGAAGWRLLRAWTATCDRLGLCAALRVMPHNPARRIYRKLGFVEEDPDAFPVPMHRGPRSPARLELV
jgi:ribosomal protein S18 acetylase RimI-like enzyme